MPATRGFPYAGSFNPCDNPMIQYVIISMLQMKNEESGEVTFPGSHGWQEVQSRFNPRVHRRRSTRTEHRPRNQLDPCLKHGSASCKC